MTAAYGTPTTGGGRISTISNNVISNSQISFVYDALGRTTNRSVNTSTNSDTWTFDEISRVTAESNNLGSFTFNFLNPSYGTNQLSSIAYPNSQTTNYSWYTSASPSQFERLEEIANLDPSSNNLSQYGYQYSPVGDITQWTQKVTTGSTNTIALGYDLADQITSASGTSPWSYSFSYDNAANRTSITSSGTPTTATINNLNQITALSGGTTATLTHDAVGNMTSDGTNSYSYDAENRLVQVTYPGSGNNSQLSYDALGNRVKIVETVGGSVTSTKQFVATSGSPLEERDSSSVITKQFFSWGQTLGSSSYFYTRDHLGSVRDMTDSGGTMQAHYEYGTYGEVTQTVGTISADFGYAGYYYHAPSGLNLATYRAYSPSLGRWINRDPIEEDGGVNLYDYVVNNPIDFRDPSGLDIMKDMQWLWDHRTEMLGDLPAGTFAFEARSDETGAYAAEVEAGFPTDPGGLGDAYRHCVWACLMAKRGVFFPEITGGHWSRIITNSHESWNRENGQPPEQEMQDKSNNAKGRDLSKCNRPCKDSCLDAARNGGLTSLSGAPFAPLFGPGF